MRETIRILHADDHRLVRTGVAALVAAAGDMEIVGEARNGREAVALAAALKPDVVVMDLTMPAMGGGEATRLIREARPETQVLVLTAYGDSAELAKAIAAGAAGVVFKGAEDMDLIGAIRDVAAGRGAIKSRLLARLKEDDAVLSLTDRQLDVLASVANGQSNADIARRFGIAEITVKKRLSAIFARLGVANRAEAVAFAMRKHVLTPPQPKETT